MFKRIQTFLFSNQTLGQTVLKNTFWLGISSLASRLIRVGVVIYAARILGAEGYGIFSYALALTAFLALFADLGIGLTLTRELSSRPSLRIKYFSTALLTELVLLVIIAVLIVFVLPHFTQMPEAVVFLPLMALLVVFDNLRDIGFAFVRAIEKMELEAGINTLANLVTLAAALILLRLNPTPYTLAVVYVIGSTLGLIVTGYALRTHLKGLVAHYNWQLMKSILSSAWPFAVVSSLGAILIYTDIIMLGWWRTPVEVGFYSAAQKPVQLLLAIPGIIAVGVFPVLSRLAQEKGPKLRVLLEQALLISLLLALPLTAGTILLSAPLTLLLYGSAYLQSAILLQWLAISVFLTFPSVIVSYAILAHNLHKSFVPHITLGAVLNIALNFYLILRWGALGAAIATVTSQAVTYGWMYYTMRVRIGFTVASQSYRIILATIIMGVVIMALKKIGINFYSLSITAALVYFATLWLLKEPLIEKIRSIITRASN